jgi:hypothetical protein
MKVTRFLKNKLILRAIVVGIVGSGATSIKTLFI